MQPGLPAAQYFTKGGQGNTVSTLLGEGHPAPNHLSCKLPVCKAISLPSEMQLGGCKLLRVPLVSSYMTIVTVGLTGAWGLCRLLQMLMSSGQRPGGQSSRHP